MIREAITLDRLRAMTPREAAAYFVARRGEGLTPNEQDLLEQWLAEDEAHVRELDRVQSAWDWMGEADGHEVIDAMRVHALSPRPRQWAPPRPAMAAAAILILIAAVSILVRAPDWGNGRGRPNVPSRDPAVSYVSAPGQVQTFTLPDGSRMTLDSESRVVGSFAGSQRSLTLARGRAFFAVASNPSRPFAVLAGDRRIVALGTRFDATVGGGGTLTVNLFEGLVRVGPLQAGIEPVTLKPGQQFVERDGTSIIRTIGNAIEQEAGWTRGLLHLDDATLAEAAAQVNRYSREQIAIRDPEVAAMRISGEFRSGDAMRFATSVAELRPVRVVRRQDEIELVSAK